MNEEAYRQMRERDERMEAQKDERKSHHWRVLEAWVAEFGWTAGAEIGVMRGWTSFHLLDRFKALSMTLVDQWLQVPADGEPGRDLYGHVNMEMTAQHVKERAVAYGARARVIHLPSVEGAALVEDGSLDFVFIDDDHTEVGCRASIAVWASKVKATGWVCGHDWDRPEVARALDALLPGWEGLAAPARPQDKCWRIAKARCG